MALTKTMTMQAYGQDVSVSAYIKVTVVNVTPTNANAFVCIFSADRTTLISQPQYMFTPSLADGAPNIIAQAYSYLKTLDEFAGATDVADDAAAPAA